MNKYIVTQIVVQRTIKETIPHQITRFVEACSEKEAEEKFTKVTKSVFEDESGEIIRCIPHVSLETEVEIIK